MRAKILIQGSIIRAAYGILALLFPKQLFASIAMKDVDEDARYLNRLFGGRDLTVAALTVAGVRSGNTGQALATNIACEVTDSVSLVEEIRASGKLRRALVVGLAFNIVGYATWIRALLAKPAVAAAAAGAVAAAADAVTGDESED
jgi:hypothetical protein